MTHLPTLERLQNIFGVGTINPCRESRPAHYKPLWVYRASGHDVGYILYLTFLWLTTKKREAKMALIFSRRAQIKGCDDRRKAVLVKNREKLYRLIAAAKH